MVPHGQGTMRRHWRLSARWRCARLLWRATAEPPAIGPAGLAGLDAVATVLLLLAVQIPTPNARFQRIRPRRFSSAAVVVSLWPAAALPLPAAASRHACSPSMLADRRRGRMLVIASRASRSSSPWEASASSGLWTRADTGIALLLVAVGLADRRVCGGAPQRRSGTTLRGRGAAPRPPARCRPRCCWPSRTIRRSSRRRARQSAQRWTYVRGLIWLRVEGRCRAADASMERASSSRSRR